MARSFHNTILRVNLTDGTLSTEHPGAAYFRRYLGGWNIILDTLLKEVPAGANPLGPENRLVFAPGVVTGLPISGAARSAIGAKSPLTGGFGGSECAGYFGAELKRSGFDAIIIEGRADRPVYLWLHDERAELRDASHLWGKTTKETLLGLQADHEDERIRAAMIGPAGENQVRYACVMHGLKDAAGRCGLGAVMGSKNLKAVVARGTLRLDGQDPDTIREMARMAAKEVRDGMRAPGAAKWGTGGGSYVPGMQSGNLPIRNFAEGTWDEIDKIGFIMDKIGIKMEGCYACAVNCKKVVGGEGIDSDYGGPEYETIGSLGSCCLVSDLTTISIGNQLCNAYSLDTIGVGVTIAYAMECFEKGLLTLDDTDGIDLCFGNGEAMLAMIHKIAHREGLGNLLADGFERAVAEIGAESAAWAMHTKNQAYPMHEPRFKRGQAIGYAVSPTGADHVHSLHDSGLQYEDEDGFIGYATLRKQGVFEPIPLESLAPDKVRAYKYNSIDRFMLNSLVMCGFVQWGIDDLARITRAATGFDVTAVELWKAGERAANLARVFNLREGLGAKDDRLPERSYGPTNSGALADGGIDPIALKEAVSVYYEMMGWDRETGTPNATTLYDLGIGWAVAYLSSGS